MDKGPFDFDYLAKCREEVFGKPKISKPKQELVISDDFKEFSDIKGKTIEKVKQRYNEQIDIYFTDKTVLKMYHHQDCCEMVWLENVLGDFDDLIGEEILLAEETIQTGMEPVEYNSATWTFYKIVTQNGFVTLRWIGESSGYYSETVDYTLFEIK